jgi:hypothetical protein
MNMYTFSGIFWFIVSALYGSSLVDAYGRGLPKTGTEWLGEIAMLGMMMFATVLICVGRHTGRAR